MNSVYVLTYEYDDGTMWVTDVLKVFDSYDKAEDFILARIANEHGGDEEYEKHYKILRHTVETKSLVDQAIDQIKKDVAEEDFTAIEELLKYVPQSALSSFLSEA